MSSAVSRAVAAGRLRKLGSRLYTTNLTENPESLVRRHLWDVTAGFFSWGFIAGRTGPEERPPPAGSGFIVAPNGRKVILPGLALPAPADLRSPPGAFT